MSSETRYESFVKSWKKLLEIYVGMKYIITKSEFLTELYYGAKKTIFEWIVRKTPFT